MVHQVFLFGAHTFSVSAFREFKRIRHAAGDQDNCLILWDKSGNSLYGNQISQLPRYEFDLKSVSELGLKFFRRSKLQPGNVHFPLIQYSRSHPSEYYWFIEHDVRFTGDWQLIFDYFKLSNADYITSYLTRYKDHPRWTWWNALSHPTEKVSNSQKIRSFNPIFRISHRALKYIESKQKQGWVGHQELLIPTLLHGAGFSLRDIGGSGAFVEPQDRNRFYYDPGPDPVRDFRATGSIRWQPPYRVAWHKPKNKLYHPVVWKNTYRSKWLQQLFAKFI